MAPTSISAKALQQNRPRPAVPRKIIPAIPLPYVQKRQQQQEAARLKKAAQSSFVDAVPTSPTPPASEAAPAVVNGSSDHESEVTEEIHELASPLANAEQPEEPEVQESVLGEEEALDPEQIADEPYEAPPSAPSEGQSSGSRSTYQMPPPFVPANLSHNHPSNTMNSDSVKFPPQPAFSGHHNMHHTHPSSGSVMFGTYPESNNSSPAPPSAGNVPPYMLPQHPQHGAGRHSVHQSNCHSQHMSNGYSPMGPPPGYYQRQDNFVNHGPGPDFGRRQMMSFGPPDGYSPSATPVGIEHHRPGAFDPSAPHSFHGSQSSVPNEQENGPAFYSQYPTAVMSNGTNGHIEEVRLYQQPRPKPRAGSQAIPPPNNFQATQPLPPMDHLDGLVNYLQSQFADPSLADYTLELRYADDRAPPVRIPGHNLIFARSPTLKHLMTNQAQSDGLTVRTLLIESDDRFLRSDGFWMAVQRLYGGPLLDLGVLAAMNTLPPTAQPANPMPGTPADRFHLALGYAAAGHILEIPPVVGRGIEIASHFVNWATVEKALDFSLDGGLDSQWTLGGGQVQDQIPSTYGPAVNMLINSAMNFIITSFPAGFKLDTTVEEATHNRRLPAIQNERLAAPNSRLSSIKFGDHPSEESVRSTSSHSITITLSKILISLPFHLLRYVLESSRLGNVQGWATTALRQEVMHAVVDEREKRRAKIHASSTLTIDDRKAYGKDWESVGWQESVQPIGGNESTPTLTRTWVDYVVSEN